MDNELHGGCRSAPKRNCGFSVAEARLLPLRGIVYRHRLEAMTTENSGQPQNRLYLCKPVSVQGISYANPLRVMLLVSKIVKGYTSPFRALDDRQLNWILNRVIRECRTIIRIKILIPTWTKHPHPVKEQIKFVEISWLMSCFVYVYAFENRFYKCKTRK